MNISLYAKVEDSTSSTSSSLKVSPPYISEPNGANKLEFNQVFGAGATPVSNESIYSSVCSSLVEMLVEGYNTSVILTGMSKLSSLDIIAGGSTDGIFYQSLNGVFHGTDEVRSQDHERFSSLGARKDSTITISLFEVNTDKATDLISSRNNVGIEEDAEHGDWLRLVENKKVYNASEGQQIFQESFQRSSIYGQGDNFNCAVFAYINLEMHFEQSAEPHKSRFSFVILPSAEKLERPANQSQNSHNIQEVEQLIADLAVNQHADRVINYRNSTLTKLLQSEFGGNCLTSVLALFNPLSELRLNRPFLKFLKNLSKVKNYPLVNDFYAQQLLTQYRASVLHYRNKPPPTPPPPVTPPQPRFVTPPPVHISNTAGRHSDIRLLDENERLKLKVEQLKGKLAAVAEAKTEVSAELTDCVEEKLQATKSYLDMQIQNNKLREEIESSNYELNNKILSLEHDLQVSDIEREKFSKESSNLRYQLTQLDNDRRSLADEYVSLKTSYMSLTDDCEREVAKNDELTMELLNLINAKSALAQQSRSPKFKDEAAALAREEERIRGVVHRLSHGGMTMDRLKPDHRRKDFIEKELFGNSNRYQDQMNKMHEEYNHGREQLLTKVEQTERELAKNRSLLRERQQKISFLNAKLITLGGENSELKSSNNRLQHKIKDINAEYRLRLTKYVEDIAGHIDSSTNQKGEESLAQYVNKMMKDMKSAHRSREDQLSQAAQGYKTRLHNVVRRHEELLCAYRDLRAQVEVIGLDDLELGPDERELQVSDADLQSSQQKEILRLQSEVHRLKMSQLPNDKVAKSAGDSKKASESKPSAFTDLDSWTSVRRQLRNFSEQSLRELEEERASLLTKNVILEEQLKESQDYIDKHLARYKEEITRLRQQLDYHQGR